MEEGKLPTEIAQEPQEEARLSQSQDSQTLATVKMKKGITFAESVQSSGHESQRSSQAYKAALSQPAPDLSHRQRLQWLQQRRESGLWVQCDKCDRWRFLPHVVDRHELPRSWRCSMNPDKSVADCSIPEVPLKLREEEDLIHSEYTAGSLVWARLPGWPFWPAMVDDDPDTEQYYWLDGFSDIPTHYNVVFFDAFEVTRAWISPENMKPFSVNKKQHKKLPKEKKIKKRMEIAITQAEDAEKLPLAGRLTKYSFISRYPGTINKPKKVTEKDIIRFQKNLKRKYNVEFDDLTLSSDDEVLQVTKRDTTVVKKTDNMWLIGTPKSKKKENAKRVSNKSKRVKTPAERKESIEDTVDLTETARVDEPVNDTEKLNTDSAKDNSMIVQIGSTNTSPVVEEVIKLINETADETFDNDTSTTYAPNADEITQDISKTLESLQTRASSPASDDFEF